MASPDRVTRMVSGAETAITTTVKRVIAAA